MICDTVNILFLTNWRYLRLKPSGIFQNNSVFLYFFKMDILFSLFCPSPWANGMFGGIVEGELIQYKVHGTDKSHWQADARTRDVPHDSSAKSTLPKTTNTSTVLEVLNVFEGRY